MPAARAGALPGTPLCVFSASAFSRPPGAVAVSVRWPLPLLASLISCRDSLEERGQGTHSLHGVRMGRLGGFGGVIQMVLEVQAGVSSGRNLLVTWSELRRSESEVDGVCV